MAGRGPAPKTQRRNPADKPIRGEWQASAGAGWQYGAIPEPPEGLSPPSLIAWTTWMQSWWAIHWLPEDLPGLRVLVQLYDQCERAFDDPYEEKSDGKDGIVYVRRPNPATELRQMLDNYGATPKGQQDRRWLRPDVAPPIPKTAKAPTKTHYGHLRAVGE